MIVSNDLNWRVHVNKMVGKASRTLGLLKRAFMRCQP